jgi:acyl-CoA dehydrogenase
MERTVVFRDEHRIFREAFSRFLDNEIVPHYEEWEQNGIVPREVFKKFGDQGYLCMWVPEEYGGAGGDFLYSLVSIEEGASRGLHGLFTMVHSDIVAPYIYSFGNEEQKQRWLPDCVSGDKILAVAMTEPGAGSDLQSMRTRAVKKGDSYVINGAKTFISNGINADLVVVAAKTDPDAKPSYRSMSLFVVERGTPGFERGKPIKKIGLHAQDTAELFFDNCIVSKDNLLGEEGMGFVYLMQKLQQERLLAALGGLGKAQYALDLTLQYVKERQAFGRPLSKFQNTQFELAKIASEIQVGRCMMDQLILQHMQGKDVVQEVSMAKYWCCELGHQVAGRCLQLFGGYGFCTEYPISRVFVDSRIDTIFAGTSEIMLTIIARNLGL